MGNSKHLVLAGDVGGTNARFRLYDAGGKKVVHERTFASRAAKSLSSLLAPYVKAAEGRVRAAAIGVAGPVVDGVSVTTNLPWVLDEKKLARDLGIPIVRLVNDLAAVAMGCTRLPASARRVISAGKPPKAGNVAVISAGTGLGEALLVWDGERLLPCATEGGHADFAPRTALEVEIFSSLQKMDARGHVSCERLLSGPGMGSLYEFFLARSGKGERAPASLALSTGDRNAAVCALGLSGKSVAAAAAVDAFAAIYGAEAGNLALKGLATCGVYLCGRIAATLVPRRKGIFLGAMRNKGRMRSIVERMPVYVVDDDLVGLVGAGHLAARLAADARSR
jgi:glucokinase